MGVNINMAVYIEIGGCFLIHMFIIAILGLPCWHCWHCYLCDMFYLRKPSSSAADGAAGGRSEGSRKGFKQNKCFIFKKIIHTKHIFVDEYDLESQTCLLHIQHAKVVGRIFVEYMIYVYIIDIGLNTHDYSATICVDGGCFLNLAVCLNQNIAVVFDT